MSMTFGRNVNARMEGEKLILEIDLSRKAILQNARRSKSAEKDVYVVASTQGFKDVINGVRVNLNAVISGHEYRAMQGKQDLRELASKADEVDALKRMVAEQQKLIQQLMQKLGQGN